MAKRKTNTLKTGQRKDNVYNVRIVEDTTKKTFTIVGLILAIVFAVGMYVFQFYDVLWAAIISEETDFIDTLRNSSKDIVNSLIASLAVFIGSSLVNSKNK